MPAFIVIGRILFAILFIVSGANKLLDIPATTAQVSKRVTIPAAISDSDYAKQVVDATGKSTNEMLAILVGVTELLCGFMIALNFASTFFALLLAFAIVIITFYFHDFWNQTGAEAKDNMIQAMKNLSLVGALFVIAGVGGRKRAAQYQDV